MSRADYDVVAAEVHRKALENLTNEMAIAMMRTSGSPAIVEAKDFCACFLDTVPEHQNYSAYVTAHIGSSLVGTETVARMVDPANLRPGHGWLVNDPYDGGALHQGDMGVVMPVFVDGEHLGWSFVNMHVLDVGGSGVSGFAPGAHEVYEEGVRFPPVQAIRDGAIDPEWERFIASNVRVAGPVLNDIRSMIAGCNVAAEKLKGIIDEFGYERHLEFCRINKDLTERVMRERIEALPDGVYESRAWHEFDGHDGPDLLLDMRLRMEVDGSDLRFAFTSRPQIDAFLNSQYGAIYGTTVASLLPMIAYGDVPINGGLLRPLSIDNGEPGTLLNSLPPGPVSSAHGESATHVNKMVQDLLSQAMALSDDTTIQGRVKGQSFDGPAFVNLFGRNQRGENSVLFFIDTTVGNGGGAQTVGDGQDCYGVTAMSGCGLADVETHEADDPVVFLWRRLLPNTGGPGQHRGGQAVEQAYVMEYTDRMSGPGLAMCAQIPPRGFGGGAPAATGGWSVVRSSNASELFASGQLPLPERLTGDRQRWPSNVGRLDVNRGDVVVVRCGAGGGLGDPLLRDPAIVATDVRDGYVTATHARNVYGVVLTADNVPDGPETRHRRDEIRAARIGSVPTAELQRPNAVGVTVVRSGEGWACGYCEAEIGLGETNWRGDVVGREQEVLEYMTGREMYVKDRLEPPRLMVREYFCPSCAGALHTDIVAEGTDPQPTPLLTSRDRVPSA